MIKRLLLYLILEFKLWSFEQTFHCRNSCYCSICSCGHFLVIYGKQKKKETIELTTREVYQNDVVNPIRTNSLRQRDEMRPKDFPLITLATINEITNHFSDLNILGQGGFGPVYKVPFLDVCNTLLDSSLPLTILYQILTSTVDMKDESRGRPIQKPKVRELHSLGGQSYISS